MSGLPTVTPLSSYYVTKNGAGTASQTISIGTASATRRIFLVTVGTTSAFVSGITIGGITATKVASIAYDSSGSIGVIIWAASVPTGTTAAVAISYLKTFGAYVGAYAVYDLDNTTPFATVYSQANNKTVNGTIAAPDNGVTLGFYSGTHSNAGSANIPVWTGLTRDSALGSDVSNSYKSVAHATNASAASQAVSITYSDYFSGSTASLSMASFGNGSSGITGDLATTEDRDTSTIAGNTVVGGTLALVETVDAVAISGATYNPGLSVAEAPDRAAFAGVMISAGALAVTEPGDVLFFSNRNVGVASIAEAADIVAIVAQASQPQTYFDRVIDAQLSGATVRATHLVWFDFLSGGQGLWPGFGPITAGGLTFDGIGSLGSISPIDFGAGGVAQEVTFALSGGPGLLADIRSDAEEAAGRDVRVYLQFFQVDHLDEWGNWVDWQMLGDPMVIFWGAMGPLKITQAVASDPADPKFSRAISTTAVNAFFNRGRPPFGFYSDRDQKSRSPGDNIFSQVTALVDATTKWPNF